MQRLKDQLLGDERPVRVRGVDEIDAVRDRSLEHADSLIGILRRPPDALTGELHGAVAKPVDRGRAAKLERARS